MAETRLKRCYSTEHFARQFPRTMRGKKRIEGTVLVDRNNGQLFTVKWDHLKTPWRLHRDFIHIRATKEGAEP